LLAVVTDGKLDFASDGNTGSCGAKPKSGKPKAAKDAAKETVDCSKNSGEKTAPVRSRGHVFIVRACGHVDLWAPIYK
jgi:hypothetical protein